tara:strand:- start:2325 stop:2567 length:243 start_codon:yes stop_codon:yes gene_type:complete
MARLIKASGEILPNVDISTLKKQQDLVQGYIEYVYVSNDKMLIVNEEGLLEDLPDNRIASQTYNLILVGDIVECKKNELT